MLLVTNVPDDTIIYNAYIYNVCKDTYGFKCNHIIYIFIHIYNMIITICRTKICHKERYVFMIIIHIFHSLNVHF